MWNDANSCVLPSKASISVTSPLAPMSGVDGSTSTIGSRRRAAAIASPSRVCAFSRTRSACTCASQAARSTIGGVAVMFVSLVKRQVIRDVDRRPTTNSSVARSGRLDRPRRRSLTFIIRNRPPQVSALSGGAFVAPMVKEDPVSESESITVTRTVPASPEQIFAVLADPNRHTEVDGSTLLRGLAEGSTLTGTGDQFVMNMNNGILGDYQVRNTVVAFEENRRIGWAPSLYPEGGYDDKLGGMKPGGHTYMWELEPAESGGTTVTQVYDWSKVGDEKFKSLFPMLNEAALAESIDKVARAAG